MSQAAVTARTPEILASIASELEHAGELCDRLETLVTQLVRASRGEPLEIALQEAQTVDVLTQHLAALAHFTRKLAAQNGETFDVGEAAAGVTLGGLASRLARATKEAEDASQTASAGDLDLF